MYAKPCFVGIAFVKLHVDVEQVLRRGIFGAKGERMIEPEGRDKGLDLNQNKMTRVSLRLVQWQKKGLEAIGEREGRSVNDLIRQAISNFVKSRVLCSWTESKEQPVDAGKEDQ